MPDTNVMDLVSIVLMMCVGNAAGWLPSLYIEGSRLGVLGDVIVATAGALAAGYYRILPRPNHRPAGGRHRGGAVALVLWRRFAPAAR